MKYEMLYDKYALERMLRETCDLDEDMQENMIIRHIDEHDYWVQYLVDDPSYCIDFKVRITKLPYNDEIIYHFHIYDSVYADDGDFFLDYHLVAD